MIAGRPLSGLTEIAVALAGFAAMLALGGLLRGSGRAPASAADVLTWAVTEFTMPALILATLGRRTMDRALLPALGAAWVGLGVGLAAGWVVARLLRLSPPRAGTLILCAGFCNTGFLGIPLAQAVWGAGSAGLATAVVVDGFTTTLLLNTVGVLVATAFGARGGAGLDLGAALGKVAREPMFVATLVGVALMAVGWDLPEAVRTPLHTVGSATAPLVFVATGMRLRWSALRGELGVLGPLAFVRFVVAPAATWLVLRGLGVAAGPVFTQTVLELAMPTAFMAPVIAARYGCDEELGPAAVAFTLVLCPLAMWAWLMV